MKKKCTLHWKGWLLIWVCVLRGPLYYLHGGADDFESWKSKKKPSKSDSFLSFFNGGKFCFVSSQKGILRWCKLLQREIHCTDLLLDPTASSGLCEDFAALPKTEALVLQQGTDGERCHLFEWKFFTRMLSHCHCCVLLSFGIHLGSHTIYKKFNF